jgi:hypothetical protein
MQSRVLQTYIRATVNTTNAALTAPCHVKRFELYDADRAAQLQTTPMTCKRL